MYSIISTAAMSTNYMYYVNEGEVFTKVLFAVGKAKKLYIDIVYKHKAYNSTAHIYTYNTFSVVSYYAGRLLTSQC